MLVKVVVRGCDDSTCFEMDMTDEEYDFFGRLCAKSKDTSIYSCMPVITELDE